MEPLDFGDIKPNEKRKSYLIDKWEFNLRNMSLDIIVDPDVCVNNDIVSIQVYSKYMMVEVDPEKVTTPYPGRISIPVSQLGGVGFEDIKVMNMTVEEKERDMGLECNCSSTGTAGKSCNSHNTYYRGGNDASTITSSYPPNASAYVEISELTNEPHESLKDILQNTNKLIFDLDNRLKDVYERLTGKAFVNTPSNDALRDNGESIYSLCLMNREGLLRISEMVENIQKRL